LYCQRGKLTIKEKSMFSSISWHQFILTIIVFVTLYYAYVGIGYYRNDWWRHLTTKKSAKQSVQQAPASAPVAPGASAMPNPLLPMVYDLVDEIRALLQGMEKDVGKAQLLDKLTALLQKYPALKDTAFQASINQLIAVDSKNECSIDLFADEIEGCWG
jgi:hypothetical protein